MIDLFTSFLILLVIVIISLAVLYYPKRKRSKVGEKYVSSKEVTVPVARKAVSGELICKSCGTVNPPDSKFCKKCGASLETLKTCPQCGSKLDPDAVFCPKCGFRVKKESMVSAPSLAIKRLPLGLEILIVFGALGAAYYFFSSIMAFYAANTIFKYYSEASRWMSTLGIIWLLLAMFLAATSWGLWNLKEWARKALIVSALLGIVGAIFDIIPGLLGLVYSIVILWYISRPHIKLLFKTGRITGKMPATVITKVKRICPSCGAEAKPNAKFCVKCGAKLEEVEE